MGHSKKPVTLFVSLRSRTKKHNHIRYTTTNKYVSRLKVELLGVFQEKSVVGDGEADFCLQMTCPKYSVQYDLENYEDVCDGAHLFLVPCNSENTSAAITNDKKLDILLTQTKTLESLLLIRNSNTLERGLQQAKSTSEALANDLHSLRSSTTAEFLQFNLFLLSSKAEVARLIRSETASNNPAAKLRRIASEKLKEYIRAADTTTDNVHRACALVDSLSRDVVQLGVRPGRDSLGEITDAMKSIDTEVVNLRQIFEETDEHLSAVWKEELSLILEEENFVKDERLNLTIQEETVEDTLQAFETLTKFIFMRERLPKKQVIIRVPKDIKREAAHQIILSELEEYPKDEGSIMAHLAETERRRQARINKFKVDAEQEALGETPDT
ncbi:hypothetical protein SARC_07107 [Sphaeroforma arctica JP610]|uniref:Actin interacting protein 3 C-terminal domain-containing protein n=1 Tax=Sphaeroforma arctica JP610 TaxID=667725 RepID=A0A0L0FUK5_9EUKA|nr:hypothetical protein SARC_07107 [Sphaeroforma arctica JP610]KNC80535.1 hypothetical protein SARC_07107 [Sphaeroforma arctica JP610]|eukprot:XP_014154437.1 hypothetical protein SARC_07107 [Sphaeroforma arctica JP610]